MNPQAAPAAAHPFDVAPGADGRIVWLASYPKSGNTWLRALLTAYSQNQPDAFTLDSLALGPNVMSREWLSAQWGLPTSYLTSAQIQRRIPETLADCAARTSRLRFVKTHSAYRPPAVPSSTHAGAHIRRAVVITRNPLAIAASLAHHMGVSIDDAITNLSRRDYTLAGGGWRSTQQVPQFLGDWDTHVTGWLDQHETPVTLVTYEGLRADTVGQLMRVLGDCGIRADRQRAETAAQTTDFARLQAMEVDSGFSEAMLARRFFRKGQTDAWRRELNADQVAAITAAHRPLMARLGYWPVP